MQGNKETPDSGRIFWNRYAPYLRPVSVSGACLYSPGMETYRTFETNRVENNRNVNAEARPGGCGMDPYVVDHDKSKCVDQQILKLQESPDDVPVGELPRHVLLSADRELTNRVVPGSRATIMGIYSVFQSKPGVSIWSQTLVCFLCRVIWLSTNTLFGL